MGDKPKLRVIDHEIVRKKQRGYCDTLHHPDEKINQIKQVLEGQSDLSTLDLFAGRGNCSKIYADYGFVQANEFKGKVFTELREQIREYPNIFINRTNSFLDFHKRIAEKQTFDVIDLDPYGFPNRFFPDVFLLIEKGFMFVTMPKPYVNILNGITKVHLTSYYGEQNPSMETIIERIALWGLCHWRKVELIDSLDLKSVWRFAFAVEKVKATEYTGVRNR